MVEQQIKSNNEFKRQIAFKTSINQLNTGSFVRKEGWESSYLMTDYGDFSRVNLIAVVVEKDENSITIDDGTGQITGRFFDNAEKLANINVGDLVIIIGRPREFNNAIYLTLEIVKKTDRRWINYRKKELTLIKKIRDVSEIKKTVPKEQEVTSQNTINSVEHIVRLIKELDEGQGSNIEDIIKLSNIRNAEEIIQDMLLRGEIFEIKPGRLKTM